MATEAAHRLNAIGRARAIDASPDLDRFSDAVDDDFQALDRSDTEIDAFEDVLAVGLPQRVQ